MPLVVSVEPAQEPVTLAEIKDHCRVDSGDSDTYLEKCIKRARIWVENKHKYQMVECTRLLVLDAFPALEYIELPRPPLQSVTSVQYMDTAGTTQTFSSSYYSVDTYREPGRIYLAYGYDWPSTRDIANAVTVTYKTGWPVTAGAATTPESFKALILLIAAALFENREAFGQNAKVESLPPHILNGLTGRRVFNF